MGRVLSRFEEMMLRSGEGTPYKRIMWRLIQECPDLPTKAYWVLASKSDGMFVTRASIAAATDWDLLSVPMLGEKLLRGIRAVIPHDPNTAKAARAAAVPPHTRRLEECPHCNGTGRIVVDE